MLHKLKAIAAAAMISVTGGLTATAAQAAPGDASLLLLPQDQRADALSVNSRMMRQIFKSIERNLEEEGLVMYSLKDVSRAGMHQSDRPMGDKKLARFARNQIRPRGEVVDAVMTLNVEARPVRESGRHYVEFRAVGRMVDVDSGKRLHQIVINDPIDPVRLKKSCRTRSCIDKKAGKHARVIGAEIADRLVESRKWRRALRQAAADMRPAKKFKRKDWDKDDIRQISSIALSLIGFEPELTEEILDLLPETDKGYRRIRPVREGSWSTHVDYVTSSSRDDIRDRLVSMFVSLGIDARIARTPDGFMVSELDERDVTWLDRDEEVFEGEEW